MGASGDDRAGDGDGDDSRTESSGDSDDDDAVAPGAVSEFGTTWMMLDGWVTRATFAYVSADDTHVLSSSSSSPDVSSRRTQNGSDPEPIAALPPRLGYAKQMSDAAASELRRALPSVRAALGIRASVLNLERSLGELMRTFFFDASIPALRPERWAVLVAAMIVPRVLLRMVTTAPTPLEGPALEHFAANVSHTALYGFMLAMPATGIAMGYYGGKGVPFYGLYTFPGKGAPGMPAKEKEDGKFAGTMFKWHTWMGQYIFYLLPVHVGAVGLHTFKGQPILSRVNPFASPK